MSTLSAGQRERGVRLTATLMRTLAEHDSLTQGSVLALLTVMWLRGTQPSSRRTELLWAHCRAVNVLLEKWDGEPE